MPGSLTLRDGRELACGEFGDPQCSPILFSHGFSDSHVIRHPDDELTASLGVRWIAADQPGVGGSSPKAKRRMVGWGHLCSALADGTSHLWPGAPHYGFVDRDNWTAFLAAAKG